MVWSHGGSGEGSGSTILLAAGFALPADRESLGPAVKLHGGRMELASWVCPGLGIGWGRSYNSSRQGRNALPSWWSLRDLYPLCAAEEMSYASYTLSLEQYRHHFSDIWHEVSCAPARRAM